MSNFDLQIIEPASALLKLRADLICAPRELNGEPGYVIEDPLRGKFYRVGLPEFTLIGMFDGRTTLADALAKAAQKLGRDALDEQEGLAIVGWLIDTQLAHTSESSQAARVCQTADQQASSRLKSYLNPFGFQIPLLNPNRLLERALPYAGWLFGPWFAALWLVAIAAGSYFALADWDHFSAASVGILDPSNWARMAAAWFVLKLLHEAAHAIACKKYGGEVHRAGVMFLFFAPVAYVDVTSSWRFRSKWQRIVVAAAGMYIELFAAAIAIIAWSQTGPGWMHRALLDAALMAGVSTLAFNANPLMRFDGYYILSDWLEVPNLSTAARRELASWLQQFLLGWNVPQTNHSKTMRRVLQAYGTAALVWRGMLYVSLSLFLIGWLDGLGMILAALLTIVWLVLPGWQMAKGFVQSRKTQKTKRGRAMIAGGAIAAVTVAIVAVLAMPARIVAPGVVEYSSRGVIRAASPGFVKQIAVQPGQTVAAGDVLVVLQNDELELELADLTLAVEQAQIKARIAFQNGDTNKYQIEVANRVALEKKQAEARQQVERLTVRATQPGVVIARNLPSLPGKFLHAGDELATIGSPNRQLVIAVAQDDIDAFQAHGARQIELRIRSAEQGWQPALSMRVQPGASVQPPHEALSAHVGGPLVVKQKSLPDDGKQDRKVTFELTRPMFAGEVDLPAELAADSFAGQLADVRFSADSQTIAGRLLHNADRWIREQIARAGRREN